MLDNSGKKKINRFDRILKKLYKKSRSKKKRDGRAAQNVQALELQ